MKIQIQKSLIESAIVKSIPFLDSKDNSKVTSNVQIESKNGLVVVSATDYEIGLKITIDNTLGNIEDGIVLANGKKLLDIIKILKNDTINIESSDDILHISQGKSKFKTPILDDIFPSFPKDDITKLDLNFNIMNDSLRKILPSVDINNPKYELNGAFIDIKKDSISFISTDTKRLSIVQVPCNNDSEISLIVPRRAISEIQKLFNEDMEILCSDSYLVVRSERYLFFTRLINGKFPEVSRVIPKSCTYNLDINKLSMIENIKQIAAVSLEVLISISGSTISFKSLTTDSNEAVNEFEIKSSIEDEVVFAVNSKYVLDFLNVVYDDNFTLGLNESSMPFVLESDGLKTIVMPVTV